MPQSHSIKAGTVTMAIAIRTAVSAIAFLGICTAASSAQAADDYCALIAKSADGGVVKLMDDKTLTDTVSRGPVTRIALPREYRYPYVECVRQQLLPVAGDYKLLELGVPVAIKVVGGDLRVGLMSVTAGKAQFALVRGETLSEVETKDIALKMDAVQQGLQADYTSGAAVPD